MSIAEDTNHRRCGTRRASASHKLAAQVTLVDVMLAAGIDVPHSCREGRCGSCVCTVVSGEVDMAHSDILDPEDRQAGLILACRSRPVSDIVHIEF